MEDIVGCVHDLIRTICLRKGIEYFYEKDYDSIKDAIVENRSYNVKVIYKDIQYDWPQRRQIRGGLWILDSDGAIFDIDTKFHRIFAKRRRTLEEVSNIEPVGKYDDSLGGGWIQKVAKYEYNRKIYANMECTCF